MDLSSSTNAIKADQNRKDVFQKIATINQGPISIPSKKTLKSRISKINNAKIDLLLFLLTLLFYVTTCFSHFYLIQNKFDKNKATDILRLVSILITVCQICLFVYKTKKRYSSKSKNRSFFLILASIQASPLLLFSFPNEYSLFSYDHDNRKISISSSMLINFSALTRLLLVDRIHQFYSYLDRQRLKRIFRIVENIDYRYKLKSVISTFYPFRVFFLGTALFFLVFSYSFYILELNSFHFKDLAINYIDTCWFVICNFFRSTLLNSRVWRHHTTFGARKDFEHLRIHYLHRTYVVLRFDGRG